VKEICVLLKKMLEKDPTMVVADITAGEANASIPARASAVIGKSTKEGLPVNGVLDCEQPASCIDRKSVVALIQAIDRIPYGVIKMSERMEGTVETSNNIGVIRTREDHFYVTTHTRSFINSRMVQIGKDIAGEIARIGGTSEIVMSTPAWQECTDSPFIHLVEQTFEDVLGFRPRLVEMHFVMEMGYFVERFPGIQIIPIGPRILEPHSTQERVEISTIENIWRVLVELLKRLR
jgi:dipeptidase D